MEYKDIDSLIDTTPNRNNSPTKMSPVKRCSAINTECSSVTPTKSSLLERELSSTEFVIADPKQVTHVKELDVLCQLYTAFIDGVCLVLYYHFLNVRTESYFNTVSVI